MDGNVLNRQPCMEDQPLSVQTSWTIWDLKNTLSNIEIAMEKVFNGQINENTEIALQVCKAMRAYADVMESHFDLASRTTLHS